MKTYAVIDNITSHGFPIGTLVTMGPTGRFYSADGDSWEMEEADYVLDTQATTQALVRRLMDRGMDDHGARALVSAMGTMAVSYNALIDSVCALTGGGLS